MKTKLYQNTTQHILGRLENNPTFRSRHSKYNLSSKPLQANNKLLAVFQGIMIASAPIDILWALICLVQFGVAATAVLLSIFGFASIVLGIVVGAQHFKKLKKEDARRAGELDDLKSKDKEIDTCLQKQEQLMIEEIKKFIFTIKRLARVYKKEKEINAVLRKWELDNISQHDHCVQLLSKNPSLRIKIMDTLAEKLNLNPIKIDEGPSIKLSRVAFTEKKTKNKSPHFLSVFYKSRVSRTMIEGLSLASIMFVSFFWCSTYLATSLGLVAVAAALSNPIGIGIALAMSVAVGLVYAKHMYDKLTIAHNEKEQIKSFKANYEIKYNQFADNKNHLKTIKSWNNKIDHICEDKILDFKGIEMTPSQKYSSSFLHYRQGNKNAEETVVIANHQQLRQSF